MLVLLRHGSAANASAATDTGASAAAFIPDAAGDDMATRHRPDSSQRRATRRDAQCANFRRSGCVAACTSVTAVLKLCCAFRRRAAISHVQVCCTATAALPDAQGLRGGERQKPISLDCFDSPSSFCYRAGRLLWCFGRVGVLLRAKLRELCTFRGL